jgi:2-haloacid dehalogenase
VLFRSDGAYEFASSIPSWKPFADTVECLKKLGKMGLKRVILSNVDRDLLKDTVLQNGLEVDGCITAQDVGSYKPSVGHWNRFFDEYKANRESTLHVAQSVFHDIIPTGKMGVANAWINRYSDPEPAGINPTYVFLDLRGLVKTLA